MKVESWNGNHIRFVEHDGEWWAVAQDVASALAFSRPADMVRMVDDTDKGTHKVRTTSQKAKCPETQDMLIINEFGIYQCVFQSHKPEAKAFKRWVYGVIKALREASGLEGFEVFRMMDKQHQKDTMERLRKGIAATRPPVRLDFIKANTIANKAVSNMHGYPKMIKKGAMTPKMLVERESVLKDTVNLMELNERYGMGVSVSGMIYRGYNHNDTTT